MRVIKAKEKHKEEVLAILDEFRTRCHFPDESNRELAFSSARESGSAIFESVIDSDQYEIFLAEDDNCKIVGLLSIFLIPQIRKGSYCAEIEAFYVKNEFQGIGTAGDLFEAAENWCRQNEVATIYLKTGKDLKRAHKFYEKSGFESYGIAYKKKL